MNQDFLSDLLVKTMNEERDWDGPTNLKKSKGVEDRH